MKKEEYIAKAEAVHGKGSYDYSKLPDNKNIKSHAKICIICHEKDENDIEHGEFLQNSYDHLSGHGCKKCAKMATIDEKEFKNRIKFKKLDELFDFSKFIFKDYQKTKSKIRCKKHDYWFNTTAKNLIDGHKCPLCGREEFKNKMIKKLKDNFLMFINEKYPNCFDFSNSEFKTNRDKILVKCQRCNNEFYRVPKEMKKGALCPYCDMQVKRLISKYDTETFIKCSEKVHGKDTYDYSRVNYINQKTKITIGCKKHGWFEINPSDFLQGHGCKYCSKHWHINDYINEANKIHNNKYDYSKTILNGHNEIIVSCPIHGDFNINPYGHLSGDGCHFCSKRLYKEDKLSLLSEVDLESMDAHQLLELIKMGNLPKEFKTLIFSKPKSKKRKDDVKTLKEKCSDETKSEEETNKEIEEQIQEEEKKFEENNNNEQEDFALPELTEIQDVIDSTKYFDIDKLGISHGEGEKFLINSSLHELWNTVLNSGDKFINQYKSDTNTGKWFNCIRNMFFDEYNKVNSFIVDENCKFPYKPNLMQKLMVYRMKENNYYGNWSDAGAGKSFSRDLSSRAINAHVSLYIVPNAVKDTTKKSILEAYPHDSNIIFIENIDDIVKLDETKYNYMIINYEKFQQEYTMDWINKLIETNKIDFICLDEIQNVKVRDINDISTRNTMIITLIENAKKINTDIKLLALSATPIINNLTEVRMLMELLTGNEYKEIGNRNTIENIHEAYKSLLLNGFRFVPKYTMNINTPTVHINGDELADDLKDISNSDILKIEQMLAKLKIDECIKKGLIKDKTIVYTQYVEGIVPMLRNKIESLGLNVNCYTGNELEEQRKEIINDFINGSLNVLIGSKPISTGVDGLQKVCNNMIIISAPWTNAEYHQLIKRIYRQGSLFKDVDVIIPKVYIDKWSWDERRIEIIEHKKTLGEAVLDGSFNFKKYDEDSFRTKLLSKAIEALNQGLEDKYVIRKKIEIEEVDVVKIQRTESYVNEIHRIANTSKHENIAKNVYENDKNKFNEYHKHRQESIKSWVENPINYVADIINNRNEAAYHDIIDMGCGLNQLKDLIINGDKRVVGVDFYSDDKNVIQSDMCDLNKYVTDESKDICIFCLSLWGTNYEDCIKEANRIMKHGGILIIVEPYSKFGENEHYKTIDEFSEKIEKYGFEVLGRNVIRNNFVYFKFHKI